MKNTKISSKLFLKVSYIPDLKVLKNMVKEYSNKYYGDKKLVRKLVKDEFGYIYKGMSAKKTLHTVFTQFK